jgi:ABC-type nitrate/sulfonate/bicarbonate transport system substrate-binding protein
LHQFQRDAARLDVDPRRIEFVFMPAEAMLPALESRTVDAAVLKGAAAVLAEAQGHKVLYQKWDMTADDDCCPAILAQVEAFLVVARTLDDRQIACLVRRLAAASRAPAAELRRATLAQIEFPEQALAQFPLASFAPLDDALRTKLGRRAWSAAQ